MANEKEPTDWLAVAARALAYQSLHLSGLDEAPLVQRGQFLMTLGLSRADAAALIGSTDDSLRVQMARAKRKASPNGSD